jgi:hypothetical protein
MFGLGWTELLVISAITLVLFAWRLPQVGRSLERGVIGAQRMRLIPARGRHRFRPTGYPVFEAFLFLLLLMGAAAAIIIPILQGLFR